VDTSNLASTSQIAPELPTGPLASPRTLEGGIRKALVRTNGIVTYVCTTSLPADFEHVSYSQATPHAPFKRVMDDEVSTLNLNEMWFRLFQDSMLLTVIGLSS
jgi:hypothetical protein